MHDIDSFRDFVYTAICQAENSHIKWLRQFRDLYRVGPSNWVFFYFYWIKTYNLPRLYDETLAWIFIGCEVPEEYQQTLILVQFHYPELLAMQPVNKDPASIEKLNIRLTFRLALFRRVPTATNMILAYGLIEEIITQTYKQNKLDITDTTEKQVERFDKLKNLALSTKFIAERRNAFERSFETFKKLVSFTDEAK